MVGRAGSRRATHPGKPRGPGADRVARLRPPLYQDRRRRRVDVVNVRSARRSGRGRIEPAFAAYDGDDPLAVVVRANLHCRRMLAGRRATGHPGEILPQGRARDAAGALFGATGRTVAKAKLLKARAPGLAAAVRVGRLTLERGHSVWRRRGRPGGRVAVPRLG